MGVVRLLGGVRRRIDAPELLDLVALGEAAEAELDAAGEKNGKRKRVFEEHRPLSEITAGVKSGRLHQVISPPLSLSHFSLVR
jgi:hypothetical protein